MVHDRAPWGMTVRPQNKKIGSKLSIGHAPKWHNRACVSDTRNRSFVAILLKGVFPNLVFDLKLTKLILNHNPKSPLSSKH